MEKSTDVMNPLTFFSAIEHQRIFQKGISFFLYFIIVNLADGETIKARVKKISKPNQKVQAKVRLKSTQLVYAFIFSKHHPFASFQRSDVGTLKAHIGHSCQEQLNFAEYDPSTGATLFDPFHLERLNPPLRLMGN